MSAAIARDDPWRRLPWLLPVAALLTLLSLTSFLKLLAGPPLSRSLPPPIEVELVELPPALPSTAVAPAPPPPPPTAVEPDPPPPPFERELVPILKPELPKLAPIPEAKPPPHPHPVRASKPNPAPTHAQPPPAAASPIAPPSPPIASAPPDGGTTGARALYQPLPQIPEELRRRTLDLVAVARFRVTANGSAEVELIGPTPDATLNRALIATLSKWRFFPAMESGKPVASTIDIRIPISVR